MSSLKSTDDIPQRDVIRTKKTDVIALSDDIRQVVISDVIPLRDDIRVLPTEGLSYGIQRWRQ